MVLVFCLRENSILVGYNKQLFHERNTINNSRAVILRYIYIYIYIQGVPGGMCQTSGECSLS